MKRLFFSFAIFLFASLTALPLNDRTIDPSALKQLTSELGIEEGSDLIQETQKRWLRKAGQERWDMTELSYEKKAFVLDWSQKNGIFATWEPSQNHYDKALILGATTGRMQMRLDFLKTLWEKGVRFDEIVWLTGDRPLDARVDAFTDKAANESEAAHILWEETQMPEEMRKLPVVFVAVPMHSDGRRPNTADTIVAWLALQSRPSDALFVSDQPFCGYQFSVIKSLMPDDYRFDVVGIEANPISHPAAAAITLDAIARWIYQDSLCK